MRRGRKRNEAFPSSRLLWWRFNTKLSISNTFIVYIPHRQGRMLLKGDTMEEKRFLSSVSTSFLTMAEFIVKLISTAWGCRKKHCSLSFFCSFRQAQVKQIESSLQSISDLEQLNPYKNSMLVLWPVSIMVYMLCCTSSAQNGDVTAVPLCFQTIKTA